MSTPTMQRPRSPSATYRPTSTRGYWLGAVILTIGLITSGSWGVAGVFRMNDRIARFTRIEIPGEATMRIERTGMQVVYYEGIDVPVLNDVTVGVTDPAGRAVSVDHYGADLRYDAPDAIVAHVGRAIATFEATETGRYLITARGIPQPSGRVAVGPSIASIVVPTALGAVAVLLLFGGAGLALIIVTSVRRSRDRQGASVIPRLRPWRGDETCAVGPSSTAQGLHAQDDGCATHLTQGGVPETDPRSRGRHLRGGVGRRLRGGERVATEGPADRMCWSRSRLSMR